MESIAFIGVGVMGKSIVRNLHHAGYDITIYTRTKSKVEDIIHEGVKWSDTIQDCVHHKDIIMTMVGYPQDVEEVYYQGILQFAKKGAILIDLTTSSPALAKKIYDDAKQRHLESLDAPVSGGDIGAKNGTLSIMVGGDQNTYQKVLPVFQVIGKTINYVGEAGLGQHTKMTNQIVIAGTIAGVVEAIHYAHQVDLDTDIMMKCISQGAASSWQLEHNGEAILNQQFEPGFYIKHFIKDMTIAKKEMQEHDTKLNILNQVLKMYEELNEDESGTQALIHYYERNL